MSDTWSKGCAPTDHQAIGLIKKGLEVRNREVLRWQNVTVFVV